VQYVCKYQRCPGFAVEQIVARLNAARNLVRVKLWTTHFDFDMNSRQASAVEKYRQELVDTLIFPLLVCNHLRMERIINQDEYAVIKAIDMPSAQVFDLLRLLKGKDKGWSGLINCLTNDGFTQLVDQLKSETVVYFHSRQLGLR